MAKATSRADREYWVPDRYASENHHQDRSPNVEREACAASDPSLTSEISEQAQNAQQVKTLLPTGRLRKRADRQYLPRAYWCVGLSAAPGGDPRTITSELAVTWVNADNQLPESAVNLSGN